MTTCIRFILQYTQLLYTHTDTIKEHHESVIGISWLSIVIIGVRVGRTAALHKIYEVDQSEINGYQNVNLQKNVFFPS